jgi:peptide/nickel transport system substrate-binding protein
MPLYSLGWIADFADADNFMRPFMHSYGDFSFFQNYTAENGWTTPGPRTGLAKDLLIELAVKTPDGPDRENMVKDLDDIFIMDDPSMPVSQPLGRRWSWYWVKGWEYNALYPSMYYYELYKENACWADVTGPATSN